MNKQNLIKLVDEGIDVTNLKFVDDAIRDYEEEYSEDRISKSKLELKTEELIMSLISDKKFTKAFELGLRLRPLGLKLKKIG